MFPLCLLQTGHRFLVQEIIKKAYKWPFNQLPHFPIKFLTFQLLPQIILLTNQLYERRTTTSESIALFICTCDRCSKRINFENQIHCGNGRVSKNIEDISVGARNKGSCLEQEKSGDSFIILTNLRPSNYPELQ
jgi:hypothetical protein